MTDYTDLKIPIFTGINDVPVVPTNSKAGNGSHLIATVNNLIDRLNNSVTGNSSNWNIISSGDATQVFVDLQPNSRNILTLGGQEYATIELKFPANPVAGTYITLLKIDESLGCNLDVPDKVRGYYYYNTHLNKINEEITLVYVGLNESWTFNRNDVLTFIPIPQ